MKPKEYTHCLRCGRRLKTQESKMIGYGAVCLKKRENPHKHRLFDASKIEFANLY